MQGNEVRADPDKPVVDRDGTVWVYDLNGDVFRYVNDEGQLSWDAHHTPPEQHQPYTELDAGAARLVVRAIEMLDGA